VVRAEAGFVVQDAVKHGGRRRTSCVLRSGRRPIEHNVTQPGRTSGVRGRFDGEPRVTPHPVERGIKTS
jgi:hypothetical protein